MEVQSVGCITSTIADALVSVVRIEPGRCPEFTENVYEPFRYLGDRYRGNPVHHLPEFIIALTL
jgi:hypothetical protein